MADECAANEVDAMIDVAGRVFLEVILRIGVIG